MLYTFTSIIHIYSFRCLNECSFYYRLVVHALALTLRFCPFPTLLLFFLYAFAVSMCECAHTLYKCGDKIHKQANNHRGHHTQTLPFPHAICQTIRLVILMVTAQILNYNDDDLVPCTQFNVYGRSSSKCRRLHDCLNFHGVALYFYCLVVGFFFACFFFVGTYVVYH